MNEQPAARVQEHLSAAHTIACISIDETPTEKMRLRASEVVRIGVSMLSCSCVHRSAPQTDGSCAYSATSSELGFSASLRSSHSMTRLSRTWPSAYGISMTNGGARSCGAHDARM